MNNALNTRSLPLVVPSTPRPRSTQTTPLGEKPEESEKFRIRRMRIRQYEREQAMEDTAALVMIQQHRESLLQQFASVKTEFSDLDGLSWSSPQAQMILDHWHGATSVPRRHHSRSASPNENQLPPEGLPISFSSPCQLEGLSSAAHRSTIRITSTKPASSSSARDPTLTATRSALSTMSSSPQLTYHPPSYPSLDLPMPTRENVNTVSPFVFPSTQPANSGKQRPSPSPSVRDLDVRMHRSTAGLGEGSHQRGTGSGPATVRKKPSGPRHVP